MIRVDRKRNSTEVLDALTVLFILLGPPEYIRPDNGAEFFAPKVRDWIAAVGAKTACIEPGSPWESGFAYSLEPMAFTCSMRKLQRQVPRRTVERENLLQPSRSPNPD